MNIKTKGQEKNDQLLAFTFSDRSVLYRQVSDLLRSEIQVGRLQPGEKLPPTAELAKAWGLQVATVHQAMSNLVREGLLVRRPKIGTFVAEKPGQIETLGVLTIEQANSERFRLSIIQYLEQLAKVKEIRTVGFDGLETLKTQGKRLPSPHALGFQALVGVGVSACRVKQLGKLHVPCAFFSASRLPQTVDMQVEDFLIDAIEQLAASGTKSMGIITHVHASTESRPGSFERSLAESVPMACQKLGMELLPTPFDTSDFAGREYTSTELEELGFRQFTKLWAASRRPEALIAYPSTVARGAVTSVLTHRVDIPKDLKLVLGRTKEAPFMCPFAATLYEVSTEKIAQALLDSVINQFHGSPPSTILLPFERVLLEG